MVDSSRMHICLISPGHLSTNPRLVKEARTLRSAGYRVSIVCGRYMDTGIAADVSLAHELAPVNAVSFGPQAASGATYLRQGLARFAARRAVRLGLKSARLVEIAQHPAARDLQRAAIQIKADLYVAHYVAALPAAARAAQRHSAIYSFDAEDFHLGDLPDLPEHSFEKELIRTIEQRYLPAAAFVTAAAPLIAAAYVETYQIAPPTPILNVFARSSAPKMPHAYATVEPGPAIYWFSQTIGPGRGLEAAIAAIAIAQTQPHLYVRGNAVPSYAAELRAQANQLNVGDRLHFLPSLHPADLERAGAVFELGYAGELAETCNRGIALTNKLFSYLTSGLPVLLSDTPAHCELAPQLDAAAELFAAGEPLSLAAAIDRCLANPEALAARRRHAWDLGQEQFSWERQEEQLLALVSSAMPGKAT